MSDDERALSDDDNADLFEGESEDNDSEFGQSLDLPSQSLNSVYAGSPLQTKEIGQGEGAAYKSTDCVTDRSGAGGFDKCDESSSQSQDESEDEDLVSNEGSPAAHDEQPMNRSSRSIEEEGVAFNLSFAIITQCESPKLSELDERQQDHANEEQIEDDKPDGELNIFQASPASQLDDSCPRSCGSEGGELKLTLISLMEHATKTRDIIVVPTSTCADKASAPSEHNDLVSLPTGVSTPILNQVENKEEETSSEENTFHKVSLRESNKQQTDTDKFPPTDSVPNAAKQPEYTVESLFPIVYEKCVSSEPVTREIATVLSIPIAPADDQKPSRRRRIQMDGSKPDKCDVSRLVALQAQLDAAQSYLTNATRTFKLKLLLVETDNKKLAQRNGRLRDQLSVATAGLQRSSAEMAKLKTENEIYAAKLPKLQAELLEETSQVDDNQAKSVQTQLVLTQLKARSHVLQTRNICLETQNNKLTQQLRECQLQLKRKTAALQQQTEKANRMEIDMNELKTTHSQEKLDWKQRLATALRRFEHDKTKLETQFKASERKDLREAKDRSEKADKKRRTVEATATKLAEQLYHCKKELLSANETIQRSISEVRTLESLLRKAHRTEATLRNDLAACKTKLRSFQEEKKRHMARAATMRTRRHRFEHKVPVELLLPLTDSDDDEDNQETQYCSHCFASAEVNEPQSPPSGCSKCLQLQNRLRQLQQEMLRLRSLHTTELHAQASVLDALLQHKGQLAVTPV